MSVGFGVADGGRGNAFVGGTKVGLVVGVGVDVGVSVEAGIDDDTGVADGLSGRGVSLGRAAVVISPSTINVATSAVSISSSESG